MLVIIELM